MGLFRNSEISGDSWYHGYKIQLFPTEEQKEFFDKCIDVCRFMYNWTIEQENNQLKLFDKKKVDEKFINIYQLSKKYTQLRKELDFVGSVPYTSGRSGLERACKAYLACFRKIFRKPRFKSKKKCKTNSFGTRCDRMFFEDNMLKIEGLDTMIYTKYHSGYDRKFRKFKNPVVSRDNMDNYFISFCLVEPKPLEYFEANNIKPFNRAIGIDVNVKKRFVLSTGEIFYAPDLSKEINKLKEKERKVQKDVRRRRNMERTNPLKNCQSKRSTKRLRSMQKQAKHIANINENFTQQITKKIIDMRPKAIVMETLDITKVEKSSHFIARHTHLASLGRCVVVMKNKANKYNIPFIQAEKGFKSTQICSSCGNVQKMELWQKTYKCPHCGLVIDRDINAALNLEHLVV